MRLAVLTACRRLQVGFMFGQYKRLRNEWVGILTGKGCGIRRSAPFGAFRWS